MKRMLRTGGPSAISAGFLILLGLVNTAGGLFAEEARASDERLIRNASFYEQEIRDILISVAAAAGSSVSIDSTVEGRASYYFDGVTFPDALEAFLTPLGLFYRKDGPVYHVSAVRSERQGSGFSVDATNVSARTVAERVSRLSGVPILWQANENPRTSISLRDAELTTVLRALTAVSDRLVLESQPDFYLVKSAQPRRGGAGVIVRPSLKDPELVDVISAGHTIAEVLVELFEYLDLSYLLESEGFSELRNVNLLGVRPEYAVELLAEIGGLRVSEEAGVHSVQLGSPTADGDFVHRYRTRFRTPSELLAELPGSARSGVEFIASDQSGVVILSGAPLEVDRVRGHLSAIDQESAGDVWLYRANYRLSETALGDLVEHRFPGVRTHGASGRAGLVIAISEHQAEELLSFLELVDPVPQTARFQLRYLRAGEARDLLPEGRNYLVTASGDGELELRGSAQELKTARRDLSAVDIPPTRLAYDVLVVQYRDGSSVGSSIGASNREAGLDARNLFLGMIGEVLSLSFDVVSAFGYQFALNLSADLRADRAHVLAHARLQGLSGDPMRLENTETFRYRETAPDPEGGLQGTTQEITSGLIIEIEGRVTGNENVETFTTISLSKRADEGSGDNPPGTAARSVQSRALSSASEPFIVAGLLEQIDERHEGGIPLLSRVPVLGDLFGRNRRRRESSEFVVYLIAHVLRDDPRSAGRDEDLFADVRRLISSELAE